MNAPAHRESVNGDITTLLGPGTEFEGKLTFEGTVRIDGILKGEVFSDDRLFISENAYVEAEIDIGEVIISGTVVGNIRASRGIEIHSPGKVKGDLTTPSLEIHKGVVFEGRSFMEAAVDRTIGKKPAGVIVADKGATSASAGADDAKKQKPAK